MKFFHFLFCKIVLDRHPGYFLLKYAFRKYKIKTILRFIFRDVEENPNFAEIEKSDTWAVYWGEYRDHTELVAHVNREKKEQIDREKNFYDCSSGRLPLYQVIEKTGVGERCVLLTLTEKELCETGLDRNAN